jgi:simple sugar transport system permease protein
MTNEPDDGGAATAVLAAGDGQDAASPEPAVTAPEPDAGRRRELRDGAVRVAVALAGSLGLFAVLMLVKGVNPITAYADMVSSTFTDKTSLGGILVRATPLVLAALAVAVPARAGLINVGGEGQLIMGGIAAMGVSLALGGSAPGPLTLVLMGVAAMVAGGLWSALAAVLRLGVGISESVSTLLLNYVALDLMYFLIYERWKDREGSGQPATRALETGERLPLLGDSRVHLGLLIAVVAAVVIFAVFRTTSWGFRLRVVGGNPEAARRAGLKVGTLLVTSMLVGGALAGLGGFTQLAGAEFKLRSGFIVGYGYIAFLASWLARHKPLGVIGSCVLLSAIAIGGDSLQLDAGLPAAGVNVLMALLLLGVFGFGRKREAAR